MRPSDPVTNGLDLQTLDHNPVAVVSSSAALILSPPSCLASDPNTSLFRFVNASSVLNDTAVSSLPKLSATVFTTTTTPLSD